MCQSVIGNRPFRQRVTRLIEKFGVYCIDAIALRIVAVVQEIPTNVLPGSALPATFIGREEAIPNLEIWRYSTATV